MSDYETEAREILAELYKPDGVEIWLTAPNAMFQHRVPMNLIWHGEGQRVVEMLAAIRDGAFL